MDESRAGVLHSDGHHIPIRVSLDRDRLTGSAVTGSIFDQVGQNAPQCFSIDAGLRHHDYPSDKVNIGVFGGEKYFKATLEQSGTLSGQATTQGGAQTGGPASAPAQK